MAAKLPSGARPMRLFSSFAASSSRGNGWLIWLRQTTARRWWQGTSKRCRKDDSRWRSSYARRAKWAMRQARSRQQVDGVAEGPVVEVPAVGEGVPLVCAADLRAQRPEEAVPRRVVRAGRGGERALMRSGGKAAAS